MGFETTPRGPMKISERLRRRSEKCAEDGFDRDSALFAQAADQIDARRAERDAARRRVCEDAIRNGTVFRRVGRNNVECVTAEEVADAMGWDCYQSEATDGR